MSILKGRLIDWNEEHETGLISIEDCDDHVRFEFKDYLAPKHQPTQGELLSFSLKAGNNGRLWAIRVRPHGLVIGSIRFGRVTADMIALCVLPLLLSLAAAPYTLAPLVFYCVLSTTLITTIYQDSAKNSEQLSIPMWQLLTVEILGGWPGSIIAQKGLNHFNDEPRYLLYSRITRYLHILAWVFFIAAWLLT